MSLLWRHGEMTVRQIHEIINKRHDLAYTTIATQVRLLDQKGFVRSTKMAKTHLFSACLRREHYQREALKHLVGEIYDGDILNLSLDLLDLNVLGGRRPPRSVSDYF